MASRHVLATARDWVPFLLELVPDYGTYGAIQLVRAGLDAAESTEEHPITAVLPDTRNQEINLVSEHTSRPLTLAGLLSQITPLAAAYPDYRVFLGAPWRRLVEYEYREDSPIIDLVVDDAARRIGFVGDGAQSA